MSVAKSRLLASELRLPSGSRCLIRLSRHAFSQTIQNGAGICRVVVLPVELPEVQRWC